MSRPQKWHIYANGRYIGTVRTTRAELAAALPRGYRVRWYSTAVEVTR